MNPEVDGRAILVPVCVRIVPCGQVPGGTATAGSPGRASSPAPAVSIEVHEASALVRAKPGRDASRGDVGRVGLGVAHVPVLVEVGLLPAGDHDAHGDSSTPGNNDGLVAGRAVLADLVGAVALGFAVDHPVLAGGGDRLAVDRRNIRVVGRECKRGFGRREERQDVIFARVHELAVACTRAVGQRLACGDRA